MEDSRGRLSCESCGYRRRNSNNGPRKWQFAALAATRPERRAFWDDKYHLLFFCPEDYENVYEGLLVIRGILSFTPYFGVLFVFPITAMAKVQIGADLSPFNGRLKIVGVSIQFGRADAFLLFLRRRRKKRENYTIAAS